MLQIRIDPETKARAEKFFKRLGLSTGDAVRMLINQTLETEEFPFVPNAETREAIEECRAGKGEVVSMPELKMRLLGKA
jgi:DNA-damage-inducible protein J